MNSAASLSVTSPHQVALKSKTPVCNKKFRAFGTGRAFSLALCALPGDERAKWSTHYEARARTLKPVYNRIHDRQSHTSHSSLESCSDAEDEAVARTPASSADLSWWGTLPARYKIVSGTAAAFVICNLDKVVMSVCIIPMAQDFGWSSSVSGLVQSSFFWGYLLMQLPGGTLIKRIGGRKVLPAGVAGFSVATAALPLVASSVSGLCLSRAIVGAGESIAPSAATDMVARIIPPGERSRAVSFIFSGLHVGSIVGLLAAPALIKHIGWEAAFISFGAAGVVWTVWFERLMAELTMTDPDVIDALNSDAPSKSSSAATATAAISGGRSQSGQGASTSAAATGAVAAAPSSPPIPWRAFMRNRTVQALMFTHFCNNWLHYTFMAWLPTYFTDMLDVDLMHASFTALLPPLAGIAASAVAGPMADELISRGSPVALVRKAAQGVAFLAPTACLAAIILSPEVTEDATLVVAAITAALGLSSFSLAGLYCTHQDLSPRYASTLLGLTNSAGAVPGIVGVTVVGYLFDATHSWELSLMLPSAILLVAGALVYTLLGTHDPVDFDAGDDSPFGIEALWRGAKKLE